MYRKQKPVCPSPVASNHLARLPALRLQFLHLLRVFLLDPLDSLVPVIFHHSLFLEVFDLDNSN